MNSLDQQAVLHFRVLTKKKKRLFLRVGDMMFIVKHDALSSIPQDPRGRRDRTNLHGSLLSPKLFSLGASEIVLTAKHDALNLIPRTQTVNRKKPTCKLSANFRTCD